MKKLCILLACAFLLTVAVNTAVSKTEILYWTHEDPNRTEIENRYIQEFEKANPDVTVKRVTSPSKKMAERVLTAFAANQGPDMFNLQIEAGDAPLPASPPLFSVFASTNCRDS